jgi:hypothetical protein
MRRFNCIASVAALALAAGCGAQRGDSPEAAAQQALGVQESSEKQKTVEVQREVDVIKQTTVVDRQTGKVLSEEKEVTPVTVSQQKVVETDVDVDAGNTVKASP